MRYVVTGGCGFIGSHLVELLISEGKEIVVIDKITNKRSIETKGAHDQVQYLYMDMTNPILMEKALAKNDTVIHLAAQSHVDISFKNPVETTLTNVVGAHCVLAASLRKGAKKILIMSTDEVYGSADKIDDYRLLDPTSPYSASKAAADMITNSYKKMYPELNIVTLRSNNIAGPGQFINNIIPRFSILGLLNRKFTMHGDGSAQRRYLWVKDAASAIFLLAENQTKNHIYHIGHKKPFTNLEVAEKIAAYLNLKDYLSFEKDRLVQDSIYPANDQEISDEFGWYPTKNLDEFLPETIEWYRENLHKYRELV